MRVSNSVAEIPTTSDRFAVYAALSNAESAQKPPCAHSREYDCRSNKGGSGKPGKDFHHTDRSCDPCEGPIEAGWHGMDYAQSGRAVP